MHQQILKGCLLALLGHGLLDGNGVLFIPDWTGTNSALETPDEESSLSSTAILFLQLDILKNGLDLSSKYI